MFFFQSIVLLVEEPFFLVKIWINLYSIKNQSVFHNIIRGVFVEKLKTEMPSLINSFICYKTKRRQIFYLEKNINPEKKCYEKRKKYLTR